MTTPKEDPIETLKQRVIALMNGNRLTEAGEVCRRIVAAHPNDVQVWNMLSTINGRAGDNQAAETCAARALALHPENRDARINLGNACLLQGRHEDAIAEYRKAIQSDPDFVAAHTNLGFILNTMGKYDAAAASYMTAIRLDPNSAVAHNNLGNIFLNQGRRHEATECFLHALRLAPAYADAHHNLGNAYFDQGDMEKAASCFQRALEINPRSTVSLNNFGLACQALNRVPRYTELYRKAVNHVTDTIEARAIFVEIIGDAPETAPEPWLYHELLQCFLNAGINCQPASPVTARILKQKYDIPSSNTDNDEYITILIRNIAADELFLMYLERAINTDADLEILLTKARRALLIGNCRDGKRGDDEARVTTALAYQGLGNEYVFYADPKEARLVDQLSDSIEARAIDAAAPDADLEHDLLVFRMYESLNSLACRQHINDMPCEKWSTDFLPLLKRDLTDTLEEEAIKLHIQSISGIVDNASLLVQSQYEENPYPRWFAIPKTGRANIKRVLKSQSRDLTLPEFLDGPLQVLIAGCGTGRQPIQTALSYTNMDITAIDISKSSLAYAIRMARKYRTSNIRFLHGDILDLSKLNTRFHIVESVGVLHHMEEPLLGWKALSDVLVEGGFMLIGLYSEIARVAATDLGAVIKREGITPDRDNIRNFRHRILNDEIDKSWRNDFDFYTTSGCRDLLFHVKEHRFTLPQIAAALHDLNLEFLGFVFRDGRVKHMFRKHYPEDPALTNLALWHRFENQYPDTFAKMYQFWCRKRTR